MYTIIKIRFKLRLILMGLTCFLVLNPTITEAQVLRDSASLNLVKKSIDNIYNLEFRKAGEEFTRIKKAYPGHPVIFLLNGLLTYWENYPLSQTSTQFISFEKDLRKCIELCESKDVRVDKAEILLTNLAARGMLLLYYSDNDMTIDVIPLAASTYPYIRSSFNYTSVYIDFFFFTGLYNYTREAYPEAYPVYKTLAFLFPKGDKIKGMKELQLVARESILFKAESSLFLTGISQNIENNYELANYYSKSLHELYPSNIEYLAIYLKSLLLIKQYDDAENLIEANITKNNNPYFQAQISIFNGIIKEKKYNDDKLAEEFYKKGVKEISRFGYIGYEYASYGYFGLSRISDRNGDVNYKKTYRKKALELTDFKKINFD